MRIIEIILKLAFLALGIYLIATRDVMGHYFMAMLIVSLVLGLVLIFNKRMSYKYPVGYPYTSRLYIIRRAEGAILVICSVYMLYLVHFVLNS